MFAWVTVVTVRRISAITTRISLRVIRKIAMITRICVIISSRKTIISKDLT